MSIKGFSVNGVVQRYDYTALDNLPQGQGVSDDLKAALLQLAQKVAYIDDQGQTYYDDLYDALYPEKTLLSIAANFQQGQAVVYNTDSLDSLKQYLTVTATYDDASTETVPSSAYTLSGTLTTGTSVITVTYEGKTDAFNVVVTAAPMALTVTNNLTGCTTSNSATSVLQNSSYTAVITASSGYTLVGATVSITMGGNDITTSAYSGGIITINSVTGALVISVTAVAVVLNSISASYTQSGTVWGTDTLDSLKDDLVVTGTYSDSSTQQIPAEDYTLSGQLLGGTSTITVSYGGKTTTFDVNVTWVPAEYQEVQYISPDGTNRIYFLTGITPNQDSGMALKQVDNAMSLVRYNASTRCFGAQVASFTNGNSFPRFDYGTVQYCPKAGTDVSGYENTHEFEISFIQRVWSVTDLVTGNNFSGTASTGTFTAPYEFAVWGFAQNGTEYRGAITSTARLYYFKMYSGANMIRYYVPCYRKSDNVAGIYDVLNNTFLTGTGSAGDGTAVAGPDVVRT